MIATTPAVESWIRHIAGFEKLDVPDGLGSANEAIELNKDSHEILPTFGDKEFTAIVGFVDMRGFSALARGQSPREVKRVVEPFLAAVVEVAAKHDCIIDKLIGDEAMIIMPYFGLDSTWADTRLQSRDGILSLSALAADLIRAIGELATPLHFSAGFAKGRLVIGRVGTESYSEWTCYGNVVNVAKRIQSETPLVVCGASNQLSVGCLEADEPEWADEMKAWLALGDEVGPLRLVDPAVQSKDLKGVGQVTFLTSRITL